MLEILRRSYDHPDVVALVARVQEFYVERYGGPDDDPTDPSMFEDPEGAFYVGYLDGRPVASGAWRREGVERLGSRRTAEIKRMYVVPEAQRRGLARRMLAHLEETAVAAGYEVLVLSSGKRQPEALALYRSAGYVDVDGFGHYAGLELNVCMAKRVGVHRPTPQRQAQPAHSAFQPSTDSAGRAEGPV